MPDYAEGDHLVKNAAEIVAATHVADGRVTGTDHAEQLADLCALQIMCKQKLAQSIQSVCTAAVDSPFRSTSMKLLLDSVDELTPELLRGMADHEAATGQAADEAVGGVRETSFTPSFAFRFHYSRSHPCTI